MAPDGLKLVEEGACFSVWVTAEVETALASYDRRAVDKVRTYMRLLAQQGRMALRSAEKFKHEGKFPVKHQEIAVYVFKHFQLRVYGGFVPDKSNRFVCVKVDIKKQNRADRGLLVRAAQEIERWTQH